MTPQSQVNEDRSFIYVATSIAALGGLLWGYNLAVIAGAVLFIKQDFVLSATLEEIVVSSALLGAIIAAAFGGKMADHLGRRRVIFLAAVISVAGTVITVLAPTVVWLVIGRFVVGMPFGILACVVPLYIAEIAPRDARGRLVSIYTVVLMVGILVSFVTDYLFSGCQCWRWMFGIGIVPAVILAIGIMRLPESPRWLLSRGSDEEAATALRRLHSRTDVEDELREIRGGIGQQKGGWSQLINPLWRKALVVGIILAIIRQATGAEISTFYGPEVFELGGFDSDSVQLLGTMGVGVGYVLMTLVSLWLVDRVGRRPLLLWGLAGMVVSLGVLGLALSMPNLSGILRWVVVVSFLLFVVAFSVGPSGVVFLLISEIYPLKIRGLAMGITYCAMWGAFLLTTLTFLTLIEMLGRSGTFWLYSLAALAAWLFVYILVPETKGRSLEELEANWRTGRHSRN